MRTTYMAKPGAVERNWYVVDAAGKRVGRLATEIASVLRGKHKPEFTPHTDVGDFVVVVNAEKVVFTGKKLTDKGYFRHSGYPGGLREVKAIDMLRTHPERVLEAAVKGMLPKNSLGAQLYTKLKVYAGPEHPHQAQQPKPLVINE
ncbi:50S ribosomal protein L13 [Ferroacidibacillus organovorans]|uniref:Large ribosomal subunit protein uL13 n=1 Tax=Ferroacidibacillus organovorans TaxID=1765683 RepID=A0A162SB10_9BACL|nr:50S ribosomal protein L13 [Ferroacidibacillus organovorans]KYP79669.1 50S ribosomal protein L13 [Ferroacidibacillus organovorans]OAG94830.1 50S ribosomal protein L13 [Ferroacidibacillus organovorans]OPG17026.1 50S ribosomal protein L13 [Ferroacidibacillus organovorans]